MNNNYVDLEKVPKKYGIGKYKNVKIFDWQNSIGLKIKTFYNSIERYIEVLDYNARSKKITIRYKDNINTIRIDHFKDCRLGNIFMSVTNNFKYEIGTTLYNNWITITDKEYRDNPNNKGKQLKWYKYKCNKCGWVDGWIEESNLNKNIGCSCCANRTAVFGINTIWDTHRWLVDDFGLDEEFSKTHTYGTKDKGLFTCKDCGKINKKSISDVRYRKSISCSCGDGFSYPEKFIYNLLIQLNIKFVTQYSPNYLIPPEGKRHRKFSDFYLPDHKVIVEADGGLCHKGGKAHGKSKRSINEYIEIDEWKDEQHKLHGVETVRVDCRKSDTEYIKNSILNSKLNELFDFNKVDWLKADLYAIKSNKKRESWELYNLNSRNMTMIEMSSILNISYPTFLKYVKDGSKINKCIYNNRRNL